MDRETLSPFGCSAAMAVEVAPQSDPNEAGPGTRCGHPIKQATPPPMRADALPDRMCNRCGILGTSHGAALGCISDLRDRIAELSGGELKSGRR